MTIDDTANPNAIRVIVIDDQQMFAESVARLLDREVDISVIGVGGSRADGVLLADLAPDVAVVDYRLPDGDGASVARDILAISPTTKVLILTGAGDDRLLVTAIEAGCAGFMTKDRALAELVAAVRLAYAGESYVPADMLPGLLARIRGDETGVAAQLTRREIELLGFLRRGVSTAGIAEQLFLSVHTVRNYVQNVLTKLGAHSKLEAVAIATREGIFDDA